MTLDVNVASNLNTSITGNAAENHTSPIETHIYTDMFSARHPIDPSEKNKPRNALDPLSLASEVA
jgi:hypothetical protein